MIINHNMNAMTAHRQMGINTGNQGKAIEKLSSGQRINRAGDDAAGLAISEKMRGQIRGLDGASRNAQDGVSLIQTAEGALNETHNILQRMRELAVQGSNDTNVVEDREAITKEMTALKEEIDRISTDTEFNGQKLLDGKFTDKKLQIGANTNQSVGLDIGNMNSKALGLEGTDDVIASDVKIEIETVPEKYTASITLEKGTVTAGKISINGTEVSITDGMDEDAIVTTINAAGIEGITVSKNTDGKVELNMESTTSGKLEFTSGAGLTGAPSTDMVASVDTKDVTKAEINISIDLNGTKTDIKLDKGLTLEEINTKLQETSADLEAEIVDGKLAITSNKDDDKLVVGERVQKVSVDNHDSATKSIKTLDNAINKVSSQRADLGALQNRLEHTIATNDNSAENLQAAESRIRDVDMAKEMMNLSKNNVLVQAAQSMLGQANQQPNQVLSLLR